ncbi:MAG: tetratricopeptide repeat protein [Candidatus Thorarchaeota archaeon]
MPKLAYRLAYPTELVYFRDLIDNKWQEKIFTSLSEVKQEANLNIWYEKIRELLSREPEIPSTIWALAAKLAWILTDIQFFRDHAELLQKQSSNDPLLQFWLAAGIAEFLDSQAGLDLLKLAHDRIVSMKDWHALVDIAAVYGCITLNCDAKTNFQESYFTVKQVFEEELNSDPAYLHLFIPLQLFARNAKLETTDLNPEGALEKMKKSNHRLYTAWTYNFLSKDLGEDETPSFLEASIAELHKIDAKFRLIIAYTNLSHFLFEKGKRKEAKKYLEIALSLIDENARNQPDAHGLFLYTDTTSAWMNLEQGKIEEARSLLEEAQKRAEAYKSPYYQVKVGIGLAYTTFLALQYERTLEYIDQVLEAIEFLPPEQQSMGLFKCIDLLLDLNFSDKARKLLDKIDFSQLQKCAVPTYYYIRGKFEFSRYNVGIGKEYLIKAMQDDNLKECRDLGSELRFQTAQCYLQEFKLSEDKKVLVKAQELIDEGLKEISDVPTKAKGLCLSAILLTAQERFEEAEEILERIISSSEFAIPRFQEMAENIWDSIRDARAGMINSPISHFKDMVRYVREAKTLIDGRPR